MRIPGKEEFAETVRYFGRKLELTGVDVRLDTRVTRDELLAAGYDDVIVATGVAVRMPRIEGIEHPKVLSYLDVLRGGARSASAWRSSAPAASASTRPNSCCTIRPTPLPVPVATWMGEWGVDLTVARVAAWRRRILPTPIRSSGSCSARARGLARDWARPRAGCTGPRWYATA
jgi:2,4-dienoyl-CoA reductase (NADPH2)